MTRPPGASALAAVIVVGIEIPGHQEDHGLALVRRDGGWIVTDVIVLV